MGPCLQVFGILQRLGGELNPGFFASAKDDIEKISCTKDPKNASR